MRLLLCEDDQRLSRHLRAGLEEDGFVVDVCADGPAGLLALSAHSYDACVLDINLPGLDGFEVLAAARAGGVQAPVLLLTARDAVADRVRGLNLGADDYLVKPFAFAELRARLQALLRRGAPQRLGILRLGSVTLDPATHQVHRDGEPLSLSAKQFAILWYLLRHRGQVVTRSMLLSSVWGYSFDPGTNLVDVHIAQLRRRLERPDQPCLIHTIRGVGYRVSDDEPTA